jgi:dihydrofolate synthase/folylpolyglutamate synthase
MNYQETLDWLFGLEARGIKFGLENITELMHRMGDPQESYRSIHVGGTNGKGSVCALTASALMEAGYSVGMYTSPHIVDFGERIQINGVPLPEKEMLRLAEEVRDISGAMAEESLEKRMTFFELTTAMALIRFAETEVDWAVIEVGMGGRLDATNVLEPECTVITRVAVEHTEFLGTNIDQIAYEKAGILKSGVPSITGASKGMGLKIIIDRAMELKAPLKVLGKDLEYKLIETSFEGTEMEIVDGPRLFSKLAGGYQASNMALAYMALKELNLQELSDEVIGRGMRNAKWPGRLESIHHSPRVILDATHTGDGARVVAKELGNMLDGDMILVMGVLGDKDLGEMAKAFGSLSKRAIATSPRSNRSFSAKNVKEALRPYCPLVERVEDVGDALHHALGVSCPEDTILVTGSLYTIGEAKRWWDVQQES